MAFFIFACVIFLTATTRAQQGETLAMVPAEIMMGLSAGMASHGDLNDFEQRTMR